MLKFASSVALMVAAAECSSDHRLEIVNGCSSDPLWIAHIVSGGVGPDSQDNKLLPGKSKLFYTSLGGALSATRFWPKLGCNATGGDCSIGSSGGPGEECVIRGGPKGDDYSHCAPPTDTKFEASFGAPSTGNYDVVDMSLVDGFTLPFKLEVSGGSCNRHKYAGGPPEPFTGMDCSDLSLDRCPTAEILNGTAKSLQAINPKTGKVSGCYSPCMRLTDDKWQKGGVAPDSSQAGPYCCAGASGTPTVCNVGPVLQTQYVKLSKKVCPAAYSYAYDDKTATIACSTTTQYKVTFFCHASPSPPPSPPGPTPSPPPPGPAWKPCSSTSKSCCSPHMSPKQRCPSLVECQACGGADACECPQADVMV